MSTGLESWYDMVAAAEDENYWPGPRPLKAKDPDEQLVGRNQEIRDITRLLVGNQLLVLNGATGDGKSSLLDKGIQPTLTRLGHAVLLCNRWSGAGVDGVSADGFLRSKLEKQLPDGVTKGDDYIRSLDETYGARAVIVLDQFEELIRHHPMLFSRVCRWIEKVVAETQVRVIVSLREEYLPRLRSLRVGPYARRDFKVDPLRKPETIRAIIESGRRDDGGATISEPAVAALVELWTQAGGTARDSAIGVLHLQALLYVLWRNRPQDGTITAETLEKVVGFLVTGSGESEGSAFQNALPEVVALRLKQCEDVYRDLLDGEPPLATGAAMIVRRMAGYLSSGGYKVDQDRWHLAELVLSDELNTLGFEKKEDRELAEALFTNVARIVDLHHDWLTNRATDAEAPLDYLDAPRASLRSDDSGQDALREFAGGSWDLAPAGDRDPWDTDTASVTGGMMMGATPLETLLEVFRQYFFGLDWLEASVLIRQTKRELSSRSKVKDETTVSLIHDGFGRGLVEWALQDKERPEEFFRLIIAAVGETIHWDQDVDGSKDPEYRFAVNLRWKSCLVEAKFRHVTFVNCDFRNSTFVDCEFEGVNFVNCLLDGVSLDKCVFRGDVPRLDTLSPEELAELKSTNIDVRSFVLPLAESERRVLRSLDRYRERSADGPVPADDGTGLFSLTSGLPAITRRGETGDEVPATEGGYVMYGGRLSSLVFARCEFVDKGRVALRDLVGTSLEFAELSAGDIELRNVALRGLTISAPLDYVYSTGDPVVEVYAYNSVLQNVWVSDRVPGGIEFEESGVYQLARQNPEFDIKLTGDTGVWGRLELTETEMSPNKVAELAGIAAKVDYRSTPAKLELEKIRLRDAAKKG